MKKILVVDDAKDTVTMVKKLLESDGFAIEQAFDGKEALDLLKASEQKPDLVILDMFMPEMSGREVAEKMRSDEALKNVKVIFFTAAAFKNPGKELLTELDISDYIIKPFNTVDFLKRVHQAIGD